jgi:uncharacterized paraquat-inducible protein A
MNINDIAILILASIFLVVFAIVSMLTLFWEIRHSKKRDEMHKEQMQEMIDKIQQLINSIKK